MVFRQKTRFTVAAVAKYDHMYPSSIANKRTHTIIYQRINPKGRIYWTIFPDDISDENTKVGLFVHPARFN